MTTRQYAPTDKEEWNRFVSNSRNGTFLFQRDYMEYHSSRFVDNSLLFLDDNGTLLALMPANLKDDTIYSHGGLTFGGVIFDRRMRVHILLDVFSALIEYLKCQRINRLAYKAIPHIYHAIPSDEDLYALFRYNAHLTRRDVSSVILQGDKNTFTKERRWCVRKANASGVHVSRSCDFDSFMAIEERVLTSRHAVKPVHTTEEMTLLATRFPNQIKLFTAQKGEEMLGGVIMYESGTVAHCQYIAATDHGRTIGAVDKIMDYLINKEYATTRYFDFGISTEDAGRRLNIGLSEYKNSYGARAVVYDTYEITLNGRDEGTD